MLHHMNLWNDSFLAIKSGKKKVEMRLNDEKRKDVKPGDIIIFTNTLTKEELKTRVIKRICYKDFYELYADYDKIEIGYEKDEIANPEDMYNYYSKEAIIKYGALAIIVEVISKEVK